MQDTKTVGITDHIFEGRNVRSSFDANGQEVVIAKDLCEGLGLDYREALRRVPEWAKGGVLRAHTLGGMQDMATLTEAGVYWLALRSDKPEAERFQRWVCLDLLPSLRRDGVYRMASPGTQRHIDRLKLRLQAAELRAKAQAIEAMARGDHARPEEGGVTERPEGWLTIPEFVATKLPKTDWRFDGAGKRMGWATRKAKVPGDYVRAHTGNSLARRVYRPALLAKAWAAVAADIGLNGQLPGLES